MNPLSKLKNLAQTSKSDTSCNPIPGSSIHPSSAASSQRTTNHKRPFFSIMKFSPHTHIAYDIAPPSGTTFIMQRSLTLISSHHVLCNNLNLKKPGSTSCWTSRSYLPSGPTHTTEHIVQQTTTWSEAALWRSLPEITKKNCCSVDVFVHLQYSSFF